MKPPWSMLYDDVKDRRYASIFLLAPLAFFGPIVFAIALWSALEEQGLLLHGLCGFVLWSVCFAIVLLRARRHRRERWERKELSSDELRVARSKLMRNKNRNGA